MSTCKMSFNDHSLVSACIGSIREVQIPKNHDSWCYRRGWVCKSHTSIKNQELLAVGLRGTPDYNKDPLVLGRTNATIHSLMALIRKVAQFVCSYLYSALPARPHPKYHLRRIKSNRNRAFFKPMVQLKCRRAV